MSTRQKCLSIVQSKMSSVIACKGKRQIGAITSAERGSLITVITCMSAGGTFIPPMLIFPRKNMNENLMKGAPPGSQAVCHPSGWIQTELFTQWFQLFLEKTTPTSKSPVILILDGHYSHSRNIDIINWLEKITSNVCASPHILLIHYNLWTKPLWVH